LLPLSFFILARGGIFSAGLTTYFHMSFTVLIVSASLIDRSHADAIGL